MQRYCGQRARTCPVAGVNGRPGREWREPRTVPDRVTDLGGLTDGLARPIAHSGGGVRYDDVA